MHKTWRDVGIALPYGASGKLRLTCPQCSHKRQKRRKDHCLAVNVDKGLWYCHHCGWKGSLRHPGDAPGLPPPPVPRQRPPDDPQRKRATLMRVWQQAQPLRPNDPVARYLLQRGLRQAPLPAVLRYHPHLYYRYDNGHYTHHPAMVAAVQDPDGTAVSLHRTYLTNDGNKANVPSPKKLMPTPTTTTGAAVRLDAPGETLAITEGIETALAVRLSAGVPVWAALSADGMATVVVPGTVRLVVICADHDAPGLHGAKTLARRMLTEGRQVKVLIPDTPGTDWADVVAQEGGDAN